MAFQAIWPASVDPDKPDASELRAWKARLLVALRRLPPRRPFELAGCVRRLGQFGTDGLQSLIDRVDMRLQSGKLANNAVSEQFHVAHQELVLGMSAIDAGQPWLELGDQMPVGLFEQPASHAPAQPPNPPQNASEQTPHNPLLRAARPAALSFEPSRVTTLTRDTISSRLFGLNRYGDLGEDSTLCGLIWSIESSP